ncbi:LLM class flavin-dependent oxidoreductase [Natrarchaeobius sp. A-rgal3]|uniref:LLM class flavin-dependent oxidoreductase n=1 Tax=Natrarchaeobius versutus TaxID=1679078 RepID=UPI00350F9D45
METYAFHLMPYPDIDSDAWPFEQDTWDPEKGAEYYDNYLEQLEYAAELGFDGLGVNEHHYSAYGLQPSPNITAANLAGRTEDVDLAFFGNLPAIRENPIRLAEEIAMLDNMTEGRVVSGFPRGIPPEYLAYNIPLEESRPRFEEAWDLIMKTWTADEPFDWDGEYFQYENVYAWPRPYQDPHPEMWMPAESEKSLRFTAERQIPTGTSLHFEDELGETFRTYRQFAEEDYGWTPSDEHFTVLSWIYVAETTEKAYEEAREHLEYFQHELFTDVHLGVAARMDGDDFYKPEKREEYIENLSPHGQASINWDFEESVDTVELLVGSPEDVVADIEEMYEAVGGFGRLVGHFHFGDLPHELAMKNLELYAEEVKPEVDKIGDVNP